MTHTDSSQSRLRRAAINARRAMSEQSRVDASSKICRHVIRSHEFISCNTLICYLPIRDEVDPTDIIERAWRAKKRVFAPVTAAHGKMLFRQLTPNTALYRNHFGIWQPVAGPEISAKAVDLVITPVVAFDTQYHRIGMGGGYFDRCFRHLKHRQRWLRPKLTGVAFDCQKVEKIAPNPWDIPLYQIITESGRAV